jgi:tRNA(Ile)-lysidine synthase
MVASHARSVGLQAHILCWRGRKPRSGIEAAAREARYGLLGAWCHENGIAGLYLAHTLEDQAETFLLRLARGSGIDGLSAMRPVATFPSPRPTSIKLVRPLLTQQRGLLRAFLEARGERWIDDPMNLDPRFARTRLRTSWQTLEGLGLSPARIAAAASHLARAREALEADTRVLLCRATQFGTDAALIDPEVIRQAPAEIGLRSLAAVLMRVSGHVYRPRFERLERLYALLMKGGSVTAHTLHGCRIGKAKKAQAIFGPETVSVTREKPRTGAAKRFSSKN